jgi:nitroreductase
MDALTALCTRTSAVKLVDPAPDAEKLEAVLQAGLRAPDHGRLRPWRFILVRNEARERLGDLLAEALAAREPAASAALIASERDKAFRAPLVIIVVAAVTENHKIPAIEQVVSAGAAAQNLLLAAHALGFGGMWRTGAAAYDERVKKGLGLKPGDSIVGFLYIGTHAAPPVTKRPDATGVVVEWQAPPQAGG